MSRFILITGVWIILFLKSKNLFLDKKYVNVFFANSYFEFCLGKLKHGLVLQTKVSLQLTHNVWRKVDAFYRFTRPHTIIGSVSDSRSISSSFVLIHLEMVNFINLNNGRVYHLFVTKKRGISPLATN